MSDQAEHSVRFCDVAEAAQRIKPEAHTTPVFTCETLNKLAGRTLYFKAENMQKVCPFSWPHAPANQLQDWSL